MSDYTKAVVFYNSESGQSKFEKHRDMIHSHFRSLQIATTIHEIPKPLDELKIIVSQATDEGADLFIAAGGDGTASLIASTLIDTGKHMAILPLGTGNLLAKELNIPINFEKALQTITADKPHIIQMDTFRLDGRNFILNLSTGVSSIVMGETKAEEKKRFGVFAYFVNFVGQILGLKLHRFDIDYDGKKGSYRASEILITNSRETGLEPLEWADNVKINDGALDLFVIRAANIFEIAGLIISIFTKSQRMNPVIKIFQISDKCRIESKTPLPVQADGDSIGKTPVEIKLNPQSLTVIVGKKDLYKS
jgi:diacylglycerol kinase (ATP)